MYEEQDSLIWLYGSMEAHNRGTANIDAYKKSMAFADVAQRKGRLPAMAVSFCNVLLDSSDTGNRRPAMAILLVASHLSTADKKWALARCQQQMHKLSSDKTTIWAILYETLTGRFLASLR